MPDELAAAAASTFAASLSERWQSAYGDRLLGIYLLGSLAHGGFSHRYSDIDVGVTTRRRSSRWRGFHDEPRTSTAAADAEIALTMRPASSPMVLV